MGHSQICKASLILALFSDGRTHESGLSRVLLPVRDATGSHDFGNLPPPPGLATIRLARLIMGAPTIAGEPQASSPQRRWPRLKIDVPVRVIVTRDNKTAYVSGRGRELGEGGMAVFAGVELHLDSQVQIEFTTPYSSEPIRVCGVVRNRNGYCYGVEFLADSAEQGRRVTRLRQILQAVM